MKIQSLSIAVPGKGCINKCPFCVSRMVNSNIYPNLLDPNELYYDINIEEYKKRLKYVSDNGCQTLIFTGTVEPQQNKQFLLTFSLLHKLIGSPFTNMEIQTTGYGLNRNYLRFLRNFVGINTIALSVNSLDNDINSELIGHKGDLDLYELVKDIKDYGFNIRICYNLTSYFNHHNASYLLDFAKEKLLADQVTIRKLYSLNGDDSQSKWINDHLVSEYLLLRFKLMMKYSPTIRRTPYGFEIKDYNGMSVVYDIDCMGKNPPRGTIKYLILRPDCHLYSSWDSKASKVF